VSAAGSSSESAPAGASNGSARPGGVSTALAHLAGAPSAQAQQPVPPPALPDGAPFREQDFALTTDMAEGPMVALCSSARVGRALTVELGATMPLPDGKRVFANVSVSDAHSGEQHEICIRAGVRDRMVRVEIEDTGNGIPEGVRHRIFDPFFTTKPLGEGTGLGLWICDSILRSIGGTIAVHAGATRGTCFVMDLPIASDAQA
jgi:hypothetical protein